MSTTPASDDFIALPDDETLASTVVALEEHGFSVELVDSPEEARIAVLARIPDGASVMTNTSVTLEQTPPKSTRNATWSPSRSWWASC